MSTLCVVLSCCCSFVLLFYYYYSYTQIQSCSQVNHLSKQWSNRAGGFVQILHTEICGSTLLVWFSQNICNSCWTNGAITDLVGKQNREQKTGRRGRKEQNACNFTKYISKYMSISHLLKALTSKQGLLVTLKKNIYKPLNMVHLKWQIFVPWY